MKISKVQMMQNQLLCVLRALTIIIASSVTWSTASVAGVNIYEFEDNSQSDQFYSLIEELRCPKCQNQNIADSDAPLAKDIKKRVYKLVKEGKSDSEITDYLIERFGDFVTYRPPMKPSTWVLWFGPGIVLLLVGFILVYRVKSRELESAPTASVDSARVAELLETYSESADDSKSTSRENNNS